MSESKRFEFYSDDYVIGVLDNVSGKTLNHFATIDLLNEQQSTIDKLSILLEQSMHKQIFYQKRANKREEQICIIKKHCLKFLTDEQFETIRKELEDE